MRRTGLLVLPVFVLFACASTPPTQSSKTPLTASEVQPPDLRAAEGPYDARRIDLDIGPPLDDCGVTEAYFDYDEARVRPQDQVALARLAACLKVPPHDRHAVKLVGHADQRGAEWYNERLAEKRAQFVRDALVEFGIDPSRIEVLARGEKDARAPSDPVISHGYDRRVDVVEVRAVAPR